MAKVKVLFSLLGALTLLLTGCNENNQESKNQDSEDEVIERFINVKDSETVEVKSTKNYSLNNFVFKEASPVFADSHIDHFVIPVYQQKVMTQVAQDGFFTLDISLTAKSSGNLYFNINYQILEQLQDAFRIELYSQSLSKSVIYSFKTMESVTEGKADLNADGVNDKEEFTGEEIIYTTGEHSYNVEAFNTNPYTSVNENDEINIKATVYFDGFYTPSVMPGNHNPSDLDMLFEIR